MRATQSQADEARRSETRAPAPIGERELFGLVYRSVRALVPPQDSDFDDLVQVAATEVWSAMRRFEGRSALSTFVYGVCYRVLLNHRRFWRRFRLRFEVGHEPDPPSDTPAPPELVAERLRAERLRAIFGRMSDKYRAVVVLHDLEGYSVTEIAGIVRANELTVRSRLRDGRRQLRRLLALEPTLELREA